MTHEAQETGTKPARTLNDLWASSLKGYGATAWLAAVFVAYRARGGAEMGDLEGAAVTYIMLGLPIWLATPAAIWAVIAVYRRFASKGDET